MPAVALRCLPALAHMGCRALRASSRQMPARHFRAVPVLRASASEGKPVPHEEEQQGLQRNEQPGATMLSPWDAGFGGAGSWGRMGQMMKAMEEEMNALSRAFGMPALATTWDLPSASPDVPATARALACDVQDKGDHIEVVADVPGMTKEDIKVTVSPDKVLQISGERRVEREEGKEGEGVWRMERSYGSFVRRFRLPDNVDPEGIKAQVKDGVLKLNVPKTEEVKPRTIEVSMEE